MVVKEPAPQIKVDNISFCINIEIPFKNNYISCSIIYQIWLYEDGYCIEIVDNTEIIILGKNYSSYDDVNNAIKHLSELGVDFNEITYEGTKKYITNELVSKIVKEKFGSEILTKLNITNKGIG